MASEITEKGGEQIDSPLKAGTLAIDLGNSTTVVAFQGERDPSPCLLNLSPISREKGEVPTLVWSSNKEHEEIKYGQEIIDLGLNEIGGENLNSDFKRWIGTLEKDQIKKSRLSPEKAGELLIKELWNRLPNNIEVKRLVLTAPVETYREYREWLQTVCESLPVSEIALVDEPTAAAMGAGLPAGSKLLVVDIGGSTTDFSLVGLEGGEGRADPIAQLMRFDGEDLQGISKQNLRCAKVLGKAGQRIGGRDIDRWIIDYLFPNEGISESLLNAAERLKCSLSDTNNRPLDVLIETAEDASEDKVHYLRLCRESLEEILLERGFLESLKSLMEKTLSGARANGCSIEQLRGVVIVGGGARIPLIKSWLEERCRPAPLLTPPPIEAVATGALRLTPGVQIKDILNQGVSLRFWDQRAEKHSWHPLFISGQPWPTSKPLEIVLAASQNNQTELELQFGEPESEGINEVIYINGIPKLQARPNERRVILWKEKFTPIILKPPGKKGEDCLRLRFGIDDKCNLFMEGIQIQSGEIIPKKILGSIR